MSHDSDPNAVKLEPTTNEQETDSSPDQQKKYHQHSFLSREIRAFLAAVMFFTRISVPRWVSHNNYWLGLSTLYYPIVGVIVGGFGTLFFAAAFGIWRDAWIASVIYMMSTVYLTGAFHEDGLSDMCDGFGGGWTKEAIFKIMSDPRVGSYGVVGINLFFALKLGSITKLASTLLQPSLESYKNTGNSLDLCIHTVLTMGPILTSAHILGRWSCSYLTYRYPYVSGVSAPGKEFTMKVSATRAVLASVITWIMIWVASALVGDQFPGGSFEMQGVYFSPILSVGLRVYVAAWVMTVYMGGYINKRIGGVIGDCLGATNQIVEITTYLAFASAL
ncbi:hypothetical protein HK098_004851 [Nowakowskiella sp. JEL0407]|nr:hypothetical protein HK098_004851 [Nowakowskiella sp. JEL0407]